MAVRSKIFIAEGLALFKGGFIFELKYKSGSVVYYTGFELRRNYFPLHCSSRKETRKVFLYMDSKYIAFSIISYVKYIEIPGPY